MNIQIVSRQQLETQPLPGASAVICIADPGDHRCAIRDAAQVRGRLDLEFHDVAEAFDGVRAATLADARRVLRFVEQHIAVPNLIVECPRGRGRSESVLAAMMRINGVDNKQVRHGGTYNRLFYRLLLTAAELPLDPEPLVSINVRVKYAPDRLHLFLLSMQRQRYENWEVVAVTDGPNPEAAQLVSQLNDPRMRLIETEKPLGLWGHPYRQLGLDACRGEFIGMSNDDNYYVPGYLEQMLYALEDVDLAHCAILHSYNAWSILDTGIDLGCWIGRSELVRRVPWPGTHFTADHEYVEALARLVKGRMTLIKRPLFVHN